MSKDRPPVGIIPAPVWRSAVCSHRIGDITDAIIRYREAGVPIPAHWYLELASIVEEKVKADQTPFIDPYRPNSPEIKS
jgi:hypothetical protein